MQASESREKECREKEIMCHLKRGKFELLLKPDANKFRHCTEVLHTYAGYIQFLLAVFLTLVF